jgi:hypothetical protein
VFVTQPRDAQVNALITGKIFDPSGPKVTVGVAKQTGELDATVTGTVHVTASKKDDSFTGKDASLGADGKAPFVALQSSSTAQFVSLTASGSFLSSDPSNLFSILTDVQTCSSTKCQTQTQTDTNQVTSVDANASGFSAGDILAASIYDAADFLPPANCGGSGTWTPLDGASGAQVEYAPTGTGWAITISIRVDKSLIPLSRGASQFDVCLGAKRVGQQTCTSDPTHGFKTKNGAPAQCDSTTQLYWGLLPDCPNGNKKPILEPCVKSKNKDNAGDLILTLVKPDPWDGNMYT